MQNKDIKTLGIVLRRTNYGEADRILNILTPDGRVAMMARGVRKAKSKLAGGVEMFTLAEINGHFGNKELGILTGARMVQYYGGILKDLQTLEVASRVIKKIGKIAETSENAELFGILRQVLEQLNLGAKAGLVEAWCDLNLRRAIGEEVNLYRDKNGEKLSAKQRYGWHRAEMGFEANVAGEYGVEEIKMLRLMTAVPLEMVLRVKADAKVLAKVMHFVRMFEEF